MNDLTLFHASEQVVEHPRWKHEKDSTAKVTIASRAGFLLTLWMIGPLRDSQ
ncbi:MAG: hypothetical protein FWH33_03220 [Oscillospiraceae bacterium]|nr:hypothetical protein [Oscillospiraceae bacterium]